MAPLLRGLDPYTSRGCLRTCARTLTCDYTTENPSRLVGRGARRANATVDGVIWLDLRREAPTASCPLL